MSYLKKFSIFLILFLLSIVAFSQTRSYCAYDVRGDKYELNLKQGTGNLTYNKYSSNGSQLQSLSGTWNMQNEGVYGDMYKVIAKINGSTIKWIVIRDGNGNIQELRDESSDRVWSPCVSKSNQGNSNPSDGEDPITEIIPNSIIGNPIIIGKLQIAQNDFPYHMTWSEAVKACLKLGKGWRLPSKIELNVLYNNYIKIGGFEHNMYWNSTPLGASNAWAQDLSYGSQYDFSKSEKNYVRAVRNL
jgi:hypothetical protein